MYGLRIIEKSQETLHNPLQIMISIVDGFETILASELSTIKKRKRNSISNLQCYVITWRRNRVFTFRRNNVSLDFIDKLCNVLRRLS